MARDQPISRVMPGPGRCVPNVPASAGGIAGVVLMAAQDYRIRPANASVRQLCVAADLRDGRFRPMSYT